jgi:hypothetical protein
MSMLGGNYTHDVFFSYGWGTKTGDQHLKNWSRAVADALHSLLSQRFNGESSELISFLDRDDTKTGDDLDEKLMSAVRGCGIFVAMVSNFYDTEYCQKEVNWFCDKIISEEAALADRVCILRIQSVPEAKWPRRLRSQSQAPLLYLDFCNAQGQTLGMGQFLLGGSLGELAGPVEKAAIEIGDKIQTMLRSIKARQQYANSQRLPVDPVLFFEAEVDDRSQWELFVKRLEDVPSIVLPPLSPTPATDVTPDEFMNCDGLLMLRMRKGDNFKRRIGQAYMHRRTLFRAKKREVLWALLDDLDEAPPECAAYKMPRISLQGDWLPELKKVLGG